jgi:hypothetical protein
MKFLSIFFPSLSRSLNRLRNVTKNKYQNSNMKLNTQEAIQIASDAADLISSLRTTLSDTQKVIAPLTEENASLKALNDQLVEADAQVDSALSSLRDKLSPDSPDEDPSDDSVDEGDAIVSEEQVLDDAEDTEEGED